MRVTIEHTTKKVGIFKSAPVLALTVEFTDVEKAVIKRAGLQDYIYFRAKIYSGMPERMQGGSRVENLIAGKPNWFYYDDLAAARIDEVALREALKDLKAAMRGIDVLVHLAATSDEASFRKELLPNNIVGVYNAFQAAYKAGVKRIVFASSCQAVTIYSRDEQVLISQPVRPGSISGVTKVLG